MTLTTAILHFPPRYPLSFLIIVNLPAALFLYNYFGPTPKQRITVNLYGLTHDDEPDTPVDVTTKVRLPPPRFFASSLRLFL